MPTEPLNYNNTRIGIIITYNTCSHDNTCIFIYHIYKISVI